MKEYKDFEAIIKNVNTEKLDQESPQLKNYNIHGKKPLPTIIRTPEP